MWYHHCLRKRRPGRRLTGPFLEENISEMPKMFAAYNVATVPTRALVRLDWDRQREKRLTTELCSDSLSSVTLNFFVIRRVSVCPLTLWAAAKPDELVLLLTSLVLQCNPEQETEFPRTAQKLMKNIYIIHFYQLFGFNTIKQYHICIQHEKKMLYVVRGDIILHS